MLCMQPERGDSVSILLAAALSVVFCSWQKRQHLIYRGNIITTVARHSVLSVTLRCVCVCVYWGGGMIVCRY